MTFWLNHLRPVVFGGNLDNLLVKEKAEEERISCHPLNTSLYPSITCRAVILTAGNDNKNDGAGQHSTMSLV